MIMMAMNDDDGAEEGESFLFENVISFSYFFSF
jgi:hypothetical protein